MSVNARACLFTRMSACTFPISFYPHPRALVHRNTNYLHCEITACDTRCGAAAAARRYIILRVAMAYKRNLWLMQRALPPSHSLFRSSLVAAATPRLFSRPPVRHVWVNFPTGNQPASQPASSQPASQPACLPACQAATSKHALGGAYS